MTNSIDRSGLISYSTIFAFYRLAIGVPLDVITKREILEKSTTWKVIRLTTIPELGKGFQPNAIKHLTSSYLQLGSTWVASNMIPTELPPALRGVLIGAITSSMEAGVKNISNVLVTRFIQGDNWSVVRKEGPSLLTKGLSPALLHRGFSSTFYWGLYEPLHKQYPNHTFEVGLGVGIAQVTLTSPFYIAAVLKQAKPGTIPPQKSLIELFKFIVTNGYLTKGIKPRLIQSALTSGPLMVLLEKYKFIHR